VKEAEEKQGVSGSKKQSSEAGFGGKEEQLAIDEGSEREGRGSNPPPKLPKTTTTKLE